MGEGNLTGDLPARPPLSSRSATAAVSQDARALSAKANESTNSHARTTAGTSSASGQFWSRLSCNVCSALRNTASKEGTACLSVTTVAPAWCLTGAGVWTRVRFETTCHGQSDTADHPGKRRAGGVDFALAGCLVGVAAGGESLLLVVLAVGAEVAGGEAPGAILESVFADVGHRILSCSTHASCPPGALNGGRPQPATRCQAVGGICCSATENQSGKLWSIPAASGVGLFS